jgi:hypothetical protein
MLRSWGSYGAAQSQTAPRADDWRYWFSRGTQVDSAVARRSTGQQRLVTFTGVKVTLPEGPLPWRHRTRNFPAARRVVGDRHGIGTFMPTMPTCTSFWKRRAALPSLVIEDRRYHLLVAGCR